MPSVRHNSSKGVHRLGVRNRPVFGAADVVQVGVFRAHARVVQAGRDRMRFDRLPVCVLEQVGTRAMQHARRTTGDRRGVPAAVDALTPGLEADETH